MSEQTTHYGILTEDAFEYKLLMRVRQLRHTGARLMIDLDSQELQVFGSIERLEAKALSASLPIGAVIAS